MIRLLRFAIAIISIVLILIFMTGLFYPRAIAPFAAFSFTIDSIFSRFDLIEYLIFGGMAIWSVAARWYEKEKTVRRLLFLVGSSGVLLCVLKTLSESLSFDNQWIGSIVLGVRYLLSIAIFGFVVVAVRSKQTL